MHLIAGLPIQYGLYGSVIACILALIFSKTQFITLGPTNATSVMVMGTFASMGLAASEKIELLPTLILLVGLFLILGAYFKVANLIQFISRSVITGYITAAAMMIITNQVKNAFAIEVNAESNTFVSVFTYLDSTPA